MRVRKTAIAVLFMLGCLIFSAQAQGFVVITPSNVNLPDFVGDIFSFDFVVDANAINAMGFGATISVSGPGTLTFDVNNSNMVVNDVSYWAHENSGGVVFKVDDVNRIFGFSDDTLSGDPEPLVADVNIMARYAFKWGGTVGDYTFVLNLNTAYSYIQDETFEKEPLEFNPGSYQGSSNSFTVNIPEPCTLIIFALGYSAVLLKRRGT